MKQLKIGDKTGIIYKKSWIWQAIVAKTTFPNGGNICKIYLTIVKR